MPASLATLQQRHHVISGALTNGQVQKYQKTGAAMQAFDAALVALQLVVIASYGLTLLFTDKLPSSLRQNYDIYNNLGGAPARPLLPSKATAPVLSANASGFIAAESEGILECGVNVTGESFTPPLDIPRWALPTDNSGLNRLVQNQVGPVNHAVSHHI